MEPQVRYARTSDSVNIAYATAGAGYPIFMLPLPGIFSVQGNWTMSPSISAVSEFAMAVWHDARGTGFSDREPVDFSLEALQRDIDAVARVACGDRFALAAAYDTGPIAIAYAVRYPERVSHLILGDAWTRPSDYAGPGQQLERAIIDQDWRLYTETTMRVLLGVRDERVEARAAEWRSNVAAEAWRLYQEEALSWDVTDLLGRVQAKTLVAQNRRNAQLTPQTGPRIAASIPDARFLIVDDPGFEHVASIIEEFVVGAAAAPGRGEATLPSGTAVILFADIAESTALTERLGDAAFREKARGLDESLRKAISANGGQAIEGKLLGDGVLAVFGAAREAIACAGAIHEAGRHAGLPLHVGIHAGDVIREEGNVYGGAVNIAARVASEAAAGETLVSGTVRDLARTSAGVSFEDRGERALKGVSEPVRVWGVKEQATGNKEQG